MAKLIRINWQVINIDQIKYLHIVRDTTKHKVMIDFGNPGNQGDWDLVLVDDHAERFIEWLESNITNIV